MLESIKRATLQYVDQLNQQYEEDPIEPTNVSVRWSLYPDKMVLVSFNDVNYTLALVDYQDTTISDILSDFYDVECDKIDGIGLSDSVKIRNHFKRGYQLNDQLLTISDSDIYVLKDYRAEPITGRNFSDTLLFELSETTYSIESGKFVKMQHRDTTLRHYQWSVKSYFKEWMYNNYLASLYEEIMRNETITDKELLQAMPKNKEQYEVYDYEWNYPCNFRSLVFDSMAIARSKYNPLFRDAYIRMYPWSDGAGAEILYEGHFMYFFHLDSVYFRNAVRIAHYDSALCKGIPVVTDAWIYNQAYSNKHQPDQYDSYQVLSEPVHKNLRATVNYDVVGTKLRLDDQPVVLIPINAM